MDTLSEEDFTMDFGPLCGGILFILLGAFVTVTVIFRWEDWYKDLPVNQVARKLLGEGGAIRLQIVGGVVFVVVGVLMLVWFVFEVMKFIAT